MLIKLHFKENARKRKYFGVLLFSGISFSLTNKLPTLGYIPPPVSFENFVAGEFFLSENYFRGLLLAK